MSELRTWHNDVVRALHNNGGLTLRELEISPPIYVILRGDDELAQCSTLGEVMSFVDGWRAKNGALKNPARTESARSRAHLIAKMAATIVGGIEGAGVNSSYPHDTRVVEIAIARAHAILEALKL